MAPSVFLTGTTGYIGGSVLHTLTTVHPDWTYTVLLRNPPTTFRTLYSNVKILRGTYDDASTISSAASEASIVVHSGNSDHEPSINAILAGLEKSATTNKPKFLIHLSGSGIVADWQSPDYLGKLNPKVWSDIKDISEITSLPDNALHRNVDKIIQSFARSYGDKVKTAIMCPPDIYGPGYGPGKKASVYLPELLNEAQKFGGTFYVDEGANTRSWVHISDLMKLYLSIVEAAAAGGGSGDWGEEGYYFASSQECSQKDIALAAGKILQKHGVIERAEPVSLRAGQVENMLSHYGFEGLGKYMFAANSRTVPERAKALFGYAPNGPTLSEAMEEDLCTAMREKRLLK